MAILLSIHGHNIGVKYELKDKTTIGRADNNDIWIPHPNVSRYHCMIEKSGSQYYIIDNNSKNGVVVNGKKVTKVLLQPQDKIQIGNTVFVFEPAFDLTNVLFDNKVVCLLPPSAETIRIFTDEELSGEKEPQLSPALEFIEQLARLFSPESVSLSHTLRKIVQQIAQIFNAECCVLFLHDHLSQQLQPIAGSGKTEFIPVGKDVVRRAFEEKKTI
ncbi:MAG: FHA domain-containing protein, partial [Candidatus Sumerlaeia bacterium]|nr:FHA domain-containing protein [Candidatus Sumerlaeia bacterium]